jgi:hypothetical protein
MSRNQKTGANDLLQATAGFAFGYNADALGPPPPEHYR